MKKNQLLIVLALLFGLTVNAQKEVSQRKTMEDAFIARMKSMAGSDILARISPDTSVMSKAKGKSYYILPGDTYILDEISSATYYMSEGSSFQPICEKQFPTETIANRLLLPNRELPDGEIKLKFQKYRYETDSVNIQFKQFVVFCKNEGYESFVGIEHTDKAEMKVDVFLYNNTKKWLHIVTLTCPIEQVADNGLSIAGDAWLFIPTSNLRELMGNKLPKDFMNKLLQKTKSKSI